MTILMQIKRCEKNHRETSALWVRFLSLSAEIIMHLKIRNGEIFDLEFDHVTQKSMASYTSLVLL